LADGAFAARLPSRCRAVPGEMLQLALDVSQAQIFDGNGIAIGRTPG
jgi:hypothetical protein